MKRFLFATLLCAIGHCAYGADTDGDGLLDLIDVPGFNPNANGDVDFENRGIQDLDGAKLLTNATTLDLDYNRVTSLENGDFQGLSNLQRLNLGGNQITSLENGDFQGLSNLQYLFVGRNPITSIESGDFQDLNNLQSLGLVGSQITNLENGAFQGLSNLQLLNLGDNQITSLESGVFQGLTNLGELHLYDNQITELENGAFQGLGNLYILYLGYCLEQACFGTQITRIESGAFQGLSNLGVLHLEGNQITSLESGGFQGLSNLAELHLEGNPISSLESGAFQGLSNLQALDLGGKQITNLENGAFQGLSNLQLLNLGDNQITSLENRAFRGLNNLSRLGLAGNNIQELNLTGATFDSLGECFVGTYHAASSGFCADTSEITDLILDDAVLSLGSFQAIVGETQFISNVSLVGLSFSDTSPDDLSNLLSIATLENVRVDQALFNRYAAEFNAFDAIPGNTVTVVVTPGDYNQDGAVDAADYVVWRKGLGTTYTQADYDAWRANFGRAPSAGWSIGSGAALPSADPLPIGVPEPETPALLVMAIVAHYARRRTSTTNGS
jgi:Leucine-rich repeat (LRR) protein